LVVVQAVVVCRPSYAEAHSPVLVGTLNLEDEELGHGNVMTVEEAVQIVEHAAVATQYLRIEGKEYALLESRK
jgi:hypothetical protein